MSAIIDPLDLEQNILIDQLNYEQALQLLEKIVNELEQGDHSLDTSLKLFERGQALAEHCAALLDQAELRISQIIGETVEPFEPTD